MIKQAILAFSLVGLVDLEAEAQAVQRSSTTPTTGSTVDAPSQQSGTSQGSGSRSRTSTNTTRSNTTMSSASPAMTPAAPVNPAGTMATPGAPVESSMPGTNRAPVINNGVNPDGSPRNGAVGTGNTIRPATTISNGTYNNPSGSGQNTNTGDGTNTISTPNSGTMNGGGSTVSPGSNSPR